MTRRSTGAWVALALWLCGCGGRGDASLEEACARMVECRPDVTMELCLETFEGAITPAECFNAMRDASCEEHQQPTAYRDTCFPPCFAPGQQCVNHKLLACIDWGEGEYRLALLTCDGVCARQDLLYTGTCGQLSPGGQVSEQEVCWCDSERT